MSLRHELEVWLAALEAFDAHEYDSALARFEEIGYYSKVLFNTALIHATRGQHERAIADFARAITLDPFFAVAHFQLGVSAFLLGHMAEARRSFDRALSLFHDNHTIDYRQLGLDFQLYSCEVRFNRGLSLIYSGQRALGMEDLLAAQADKQSDMHDVIDEAISDRAVGYTVFSIPVGIVFRPPAYKVENLDTRDYLGKARVVAATEAADLSMGFPGARNAQDECRSTREDRARRCPDYGSGERRKTKFEKVADLEAFSRVGLDLVCYTRGRPVDPQPGTSDCAELVCLTTIVDEPSRFAQLQKEAGKEHHPTRETTGTALPTAPGAVYPSSSTVPTEAIQPQPARSAPPPPPSIEARDILVSALTLLRAESPPLMRTHRTPDIDPTALARSGTDSYKSGSAPQNQLPGGQAAGPPSQTVFGRSGSAAPAASVEGLSRLKPTMQKIRVKLHWVNESLQPDASLEMLLQHVATKLGLDASFHLTFRDVDGTVVTVRDEEDWEYAVDIAREGVTGPVGTGQLEIDVVVP
ncbi:hypothetical protein B0A53_04185 [Rhodotorula sp. CCFEE 5036]|nr:hypothetical protein B0A53_04185 [Rhodotorula sp. CCFEE 5036]